MFVRGNRKLDNASEKSLINQMNKAEEAYAFFDQEQKSFAIKSGFDFLAGTPVSHLQDMIHFLFSGSFNVQSLVMSDY